MWHSAMRASAEAEFEGRVNARVVTTWRILALARAARRATAAYPYHRGVC